MDRIEEIRQLKDGWLDGAGLAPRSDHLDWFVAAFERYYPDDLPPPYIYPTASGDLQAEWSLARDEISIEIDLASRRAFWHALAKDGDGESAFEVDLGSELGWVELAHLIRGHCSQAD